MSVLPEIRTPLPGPRAAAWIARDRAVLSPSYARDYPLVVAVLLAVSLLVVAANVVTDTLYVAADPRLDA